MALLALLALLIALVWLAAYLRFTGLSGGILLVAVTGIVLGRPFFHRNVGPLPVTIDRILLAAVGLFAIWLIRKNDLRLPTLSRTRVAAGALLFVLLASTLTHDWKTDGFQPLATWLFFYAIPLFAFALVQLLPLEKKDAQLWIAGLITLGGYLAFIGICETRELYGLVWPRFIVDASYAEFLGRARGPLLNPIGNGIVMTVAATASLLLAWKRRAPAIALGVGALVFTLMGIYLTRTRSVWLGAAAALWLVTALQVPRRLAIAGTCWALLAALLLVGTQWEKLNAFKRDRNVSVADMSESASLRPILATIAWKMFQDKPLFGFGFGQYGAEAAPYCAERDTELPLDRGRPYVQHNVFLSLLTETGLVGLVLLIWLIFSVAQDAVRVLFHSSATPWQRDLALLTLAALTSYVVNGMFHEVAIIPMVHFLVFTLSGLTCQVAVALHPQPHAHPLPTPTSDTVVPSLAS